MHNRFDESFFVKEKMVLSPSAKEIKAKEKMRRLKEVALRNDFDSLQLLSSIKLEPLINKRLKTLISKREKSLRSIKGVAIALEEEGGDASSLLEGLLELRNLTLQVIAAVVEWRSKQPTLKPLLWRGQNYLIKIQV